MSKVLLVSYHFPPSSQIAAKRAERLARLLPTFGHGVDIVCASPEDGIGEADFTFREDLHIDTQVYRIDTPFVFGRNPYANMNSMPIHRRYWWKVRARAEHLFLTKDWSWNWGAAALSVIRHSAVVEELSAVVVSGPPFHALLPFLRWARERDIPTITDLRDFWWVGDTRQSLPGVVLPSTRRNRWSLRLRDDLVRASDHIVFTNEGAVELMKSTYPGISSDRFSVVTNAYEGYDEIEDVLGYECISADHPSTVTLRLSHTGSLAYGRDALAVNLIKAMGDLKRRGQDGYQLILAGEPEEAVERTVIEEGLTEQVQLMQWLQHEEALEIQRHSDALVLFQPGWVSDVAVPAKLFEYMARRRPVLALTSSGPASKIIEEHQLGRAIFSADPTEIACSLETFTKEVCERPVLPPPPAQFSESRTISDFAAILDTLVS